MICHYCKYIFAYFCLVNKQTCTFQGLVCYFQIHIRWSNPTPFFSNLTFSPFVFTVYQMSLKITIYKWSISFLSLSHTTSRHVLQSFQRTHAVQIQHIQEPRTVRWPDQFVYVPTSNCKFHLPINLLPFSAKGRLCPVLLHFRFHLGNFNPMEAATGEKKIKILVFFPFFKNIHV